MTNPIQPNNEYAGKPIPPLREGKYIIYFGEDGKVSDIREEDDRMRLLKDEDNLS